MAMARLHVDNLARGATPGALAKHLGLTTLGPQVRVDLVFDSVTGCCGGQGVISVPEDKVDYVLAKNKLPFLDKHLCIAYIPSQIIEENMKKAERALREEEQRVPSVTITDVDGNSASSLQQGMENLSVGETKDPLVNGSEGAAGEPNDYIAGFADLQPTTANSQAGDANNNKSKKDQNLNSKSQSAQKPQESGKRKTSKPPPLLSRKTPIAPLLPSPGAMRYDDSAWAHNMNYRNQAQGFNNGPYPPQNYSNYPPFDYGPSFDYGPTFDFGPSGQRWSQPCFQAPPPTGLPPFDYRQAVYLPKSVRKEYKKSDQLNLSAKKNIKTKGSAPSTIHGISGSSCNGDGSLPFKYRMIDAAAILTHPRLARNVHSVVMRAQSVGVESIVSLGMDIRGSQDAKQLAEKYPHQVYFSTGFHPHNARRWKPGMEEELEKLAVHPKCVAIGECGLDFCRDFSPRDMQIKAFEAQVKLACKVKKPLILHVRDADEEVRDILSAYLDDLPPTLVHCFSGDHGDALKYLAMGFYFGITGFVCKTRHSTGLRAVLSDCEIPEDKLILETDCPFMYPSMDPKFPKEVADTVTSSTQAIVNTLNAECNEPCLLPMVVEVVAGFMKKTPQEISDIAYNNAKRFYNI